MSVKTMREIIVQPETKTLTIPAGEDVFIIDNLRLNQIANLKIVIGDQSRVNYIFIAEGECLATAAREISSGQAVVLRAFQTCLETSSSEISFENIIGSRADVSQQSLFIVRKQQDLRFNDRHIFCHPGSKGRFLAEGLVDDSGRVEHTGTVIIKPEAKLTDSRIDLKLNILGAKATGQMQPALYIETNEVKAGHGASTFNLGAEELFYFNSRGLTEVQAKTLALKSAVQRFMDAISDDIGAKAELHNLLNKHL